MKRLIILALVTMPAMAQESTDPMNMDMKGGYKVTNDKGEFRGNLNNNRFDPDSVANPTGRYGNKYSPESINNQQSSEHYRMERQKPVFIEAE